jgi:acyl carrier protein
MSLSADQVVTDIKHILVEELFIDIPKDELKDDDLLSNGIGLDSVGLLELIAIVEEKYAITVERRNDNEGTLTLAQFARYVAERANVRRASQS